MLLQSLYRLPQLGIMLKSLRLSIAKAQNLLLQWLELELSILQSRRQLFLSLQLVEYPINLTNSPIISINLTLH